MEKNFMVKCIQYVQTFTGVPKYKNLFLHIKPQTCSIYSESSSL